MARAVVDVCIPVYHRNVLLLPLCLQKLNECTDVPWRAIVALDGGNAEDVAVAETAIREHASHAPILLHNREVVYHNELAARVLDRGSAALVALMAPEVEIEDPQWFGRMQMPYLRDGLTMLVAAEINQQWSTLPPRRLERRELPHQALVLLRRSALRELGTRCEAAVPIVAHLAKRVAAIGGTAWTVPSVRISVRGSSAYTPLIDAHHTPREVPADRLKTPPEAILR